jgi:hypothetical protein
VSTTPVENEIFDSVPRLGLVDPVNPIGPSEPMQSDQTCFFSNIFLKFYNIIKIII